MVAEPHPYRLSVEQYDCLVATGALEGEHVELLDGEIIEMSPIGQRQVTSVRRLTGIFHTAGVTPGTVLVQLPIFLNPESEPQPDLVILRPPPEQYDQRPAAASDVLLLVEVSESSLNYDRRRKLPRYAEAGIPEVWIVNLVDDVVHVFGEPIPDGYQVVRNLRRGEIVQARLIEALRVGVDDILGPPAVV